ncbi:MAG: hypothetical protein DLM52_05830 [Chthoniobacterales bacterium]|nr:MAG: hypothetical protein DLM52_05830 [Chthoniobacterales bacterium]
MLFYRAGFFFILVGALVATTSFAGPEPTPSSKDIPLQSEGTSFEAPPSSHGLITTEGPSGMFINPTSATLPQGAFILNYCVFVPTIPEGVGAVWHGVLLSYGVRDWLEIGFIANLADVSLDGPPAREDSFIFAGPMARIRLLRDHDWWPELSIGAYIREGTPANIFNGENAFIAASKRFPIANNALLKSVTLQGGFREAWLHDEAPVSNINRFYGGVEVELPHNFYMIGEISQRDDRVESKVPWAAGIQWRGKHFGCSIAAVQLDGETGPGFYFGVGGGLGAEPVRSSPPPPSRRY